MLVNKSWVADSYFSDAKIMTKALPNILLLILWELLQSLRSKHSSTLYLIYYVLSITWERNETNQSRRFHLHHQV